MVRIALLLALTTMIIYGMLHVAIWVLEGAIEKGSESKKNCEKHEELPNENTESFDKMKYKYEVTKDLLDRTRKRLLEKEEEINMLKDYITKLMAENKTTGEERTWKDNIMDRFTKTE